MISSIITMHASDLFLYPQRERERKTQSTWVGRLDTKKSDYQMINLLIHNKPNNKADIVWSYINSMLATITSIVHKIETSPLSSCR